MDRFLRTKMLLSEEKFNLLASKKVIVFGLGGVGSYVLEALARAGIQNIDIVDSDVVNITNINRQIIAIDKTVGKTKVEVCKERILSINPDAQVNCYQLFVNSETINEINLKNYDYIIDAIDTVTSKLLLIKEAKKQNINVISCMGTGNKLDASKFTITDISKTKVCPLAKVIRKELKKLNIKNVKVLYSTEEPIDITKNIQDMKINIESKGNGYVPASISYVPAVAGLLIAGEVIRDLIK